MGFEARWQELREIVRKEYPGDEVGTVDEAVARGMEKKAVLEAIERYGAARAQRLERLAAGVDLGGNAEKAWESEAALLRAELRTFAECLRDVKTPTMLGLKIVTGGALEEEKLCDAFDRAKAVGTAMDALARYGRELAEKADALKAKWDESRRIAEAIMREEATVLEELATVMREAVATQADKARNRRELARAWVKAGADAASLVGAVLPVPSVLKDLLGNAKEAAELWEKLAGDLAARKARYEAYFRQDHQSLLVMFKGTRDDARDFLDKHDYTRLALDWTSKARSALSDLRSAATTSGQRSDADALASQALAKVDDAEKAAKERWDRFVSENRTQFFGAFSPELDQAILGGERWKEAYGKIAAIDLQGLLSRWIEDDARDWREIDASQMPEAWRDEFRNAVKGSLERLASTEEEIRRNSSPDLLMTWIAGTPAELANRLR